MYYTRFNTPFCEIIIAGNEEGLTNLHLNTGEGKREFEIADAWHRKDAFFAEAVRQIEEYCTRRRTQFDLTLNPCGTAFQKRVWKALTEIDFGELKTYKEVATILGNEKATRAVGLANSKNPIPLIIPCHRVIGSNGKLTGFAHGLAIKERLIEFEKER